jgi:hypothetical protein
MMYLGDDHVLIKANPEPYVFSMYNSVKMDSLVLAKLKLRTSLFDDAKILNKNKAVVFLNQKAPSQLTSGLPLRAVIVPHISQENETIITQASPMTAVKALAPSTILMLSGAGKKDLSEMAKTVQQVPCYSLQIGNNLWDVPELIQQVLS